jgi:Predicted membrane protein
MSTINEANIEKEASLIKMKRIALAVLGFAVVCFFVAHYFEIPWLKALSEAAMVGGIADWFAVVALFRHPLGIPIPHTALIPTNKDAIGKNLGDFVSDEFLIKEKLEVKIDEFNFAIKATDWLKEEKNASKIASLVVENVIPGILKTVDDEDVKHFIRTQFEAKLQEMNFGQWIAVGLESLTKSEKQAQLISNMLVILSEELEANKELIREKVKGSTPWYTLGIADKKIADGVFNGLYEFINQAKESDSAIRQKINLYVVQFIEELKSSPEMQQKINAMVIEFTHKKEVQDYINDIWKEIKNAVTTDLEKGDGSKIKESLITMISNFGKNIQEDPLMMAKINDFIKVDLLGILLRNKKAIGDLIANSVKSWDKKEISNKLELEIGKDLQYIRINGTVVGGLVGLLIYFVEQFL